MGFNSGFKGLSGSGRYKDNWERNERTKEGKKRNWKWCP